MKKFKVFVFIFLLAAAVYLGQKYIFQVDAGKTKVMPAAVQSQKRPPVKAANKVYPYYYVAPKPQPKPAINKRPVKKVIRKIVLPTKAQVLKKVK